MTILATTPEQQISQLLGATVEQLDLTPAEFDAAERCYRDLGAHLSEANAEVYVQGSFLLGTVVRPHDRDGEYDLDLVAKVNVARTSLSQKDLKDRVGKLLHDYRDDHDGGPCESPNEVSEGRRSWCLHYGTFHMDVLPCIPDSDATSPTAIELTDLQLREWQKSDPHRYVEWFRRQCAKQFEESRVVLSKEYGSVEDVPKHRVRTPLHRVVQILKRHRDIYFTDDHDDRPPSSLITTLAGLAYEGETDLVAAALAAVQRMPDHVEVRNGKFWVENPACAGENFADKWNDYDQRRLKFNAWRATVEQDLRGFLTETRGTVALHQRISKAFGSAPVEEAVRVLGTRTNVAREQGAVNLAAGGLLTTAATATSLPKHRFYGAETTP